ncbi:MAG: hypothetical protein DGJ47_000371 [Rickettsiaceae bacterium]
MLQNLNFNNSDINFVAFCNTAGHKKAIIKVVNNSDIFPFIRHSGTWDRNLLKNVCGKYTDTYLHLDLTSEFALCWLFYQNKQLIGRGGIQSFKNKYISGVEIYLAILPEHRRQGFAKSIILILENYAKLYLGIDYIYANIMMSNGPSINLFDGLGYKSILEYQKVKMWGVDYLTLRKTLSF